MNPVPKRFRAVAIGSLVGVTGDRLLGGNRRASPPDRLPQAPA